MRSFGPSVVREDDGTFRASCSYCTFRENRTCSYVRPSQEIPDPSNTPEWCEMREGMLRDAADMHNGVTHYVMRWSGRKTDEPREVFAGIPSEAHRQMRLIGRDMKRGAVYVVDAWDKEVARYSREAAE
jgi:hypothetical protein